MTWWRYLYEFSIAGALVSCASAIDDRGGAPLLDNGELRINQRVTVTGEVAEVRGEQAFVLTNNDLTGKERLLVITKRPVWQVTLGSATVLRGEWLHIYGTVQRLSVPEVERAYGFDLDSDLEVAYDSRPVLVTDQIR